MPNSLQIVLTWTYRPTCACIRLGSHRPQVPLEDVHRTFDTAPSMSLVSIRRPSPSTSETPSLSGTCMCDRASDASSHPLTSKSSETTDHPRVQLYVPAPEYFIASPCSLARVLLVSWHFLLSFYGDPFLTRDKRHGRFRIRWSHTPCLTSSLGHFSGRLI